MENLTIKSSYFGINGAFSIPLIHIEGTKTNNGDNFKTYTKT